MFEKLWKGFNGVSLNLKTQGRHWPMVQPWKMSWWLLQVWRTACRLPGIGAQDSPFVSLSSKCHVWMKVLPSPPNHRGPWTQWSLLCQNEYSIPVHFSTNERAGDGHGWGDRAADHAIFSLRGSSFSQHTQKNYWTKVQVGRKWVGERQSRYRTRHLSFCVYIFKKWKSKKGWCWKIPA